MVEKISEQPVRIEKIEKLKAKLLPEIETQLKKCNISDDDFEYFVRQNFALLELKRYLTQENCFMKYNAVYPISDKIFYKVKEKYLDIWLQDDYYFISNFLIAAEECKYDMAQLLNDDYFGNYFVSVIEEVIYDEKHGK